MLKLTTSWAWDFKNRNHQKLPRLWKIANVVIGEVVTVKANRWSRNVNDVLVHKILSPRGLDTWDKIEVGFTVGDYKMKDGRRWNFSFNWNKQFFFFRTKAEAEQKLLSLRSSIEHYNEMQVERYREITMKKLDKMNKSILKLDKLEKKHLKNKS